MELLVVITALANITLIFVLIFAVPKLAEGHRKIGDTAQRLGELVHLRWKPIKKDGLQERAYKLLMDEFLDEQPSLKGSTKELRDKAFAQWIRSRQKKGKA